MSADDERDRDEERANEQLLRDEPQIDPELLPLALRVAHDELDACERRSMVLESKLREVRHVAGAAVQLLGDTLRSIAAASDDHDTATLRGLAKLGAQHADNAIRELTR